MTSVQRRYVNKTRLIKLIFELIKTRKHATLSTYYLLQNIANCIFFSILAFSYLTFQSFALCFILWVKE